MSLATKQELEAVIGAMYNDLCVAIDKASNDADRERGYREGLIQSRDLLGIAVKTWRIAIPEIDNETKKEK